MVKAKDVALTLGAIGAIITYALFARRPTEPPPGESSGQVSIRLEMPAYADFYGNPSLPTDVAAIMAGTATGGTQPIDMGVAFEVYSVSQSRWVNMGGSPPLISNVPLNVPQTFTAGPFGPAQLETAVGQRTGNFRGRASMTLINAAGAFGFQSTEVAFTITEIIAPTGQVGINVT